MESEVKNIIISVSSSAIVLTLPEVKVRVTMIEVGEKERKADSHCKNVIALHFI